MSTIGETMKGIDRLGPQQVTEMLAGVTDTVVIDASSADVDSTNAILGTFLNCRYISVDTSGVIKLDILDVGGNSKTIVFKPAAGVLIQIRNVVKVYHHYVGTTDCTASAYGSDGVERVGIRLWR